MTKHATGPKEPRTNEDTKNRMSRRTFFQGVGGTALTAAILPATQAAVAEEEEALKGVTLGTITLTVNGKPRTVPRVEPRTTLLDVLRNRLALTGSKPVCERTSCGGCTVIMNGKTVYACSILAMDADGAEITTIEGLATDERLHPVQEAFIEKDAVMCGFCTPGFVVSVAALLNENPSPSPEEIRRAVSGNICRCGTYTRVFEAAEAAAQRMRKGA